MKTFLIHQSFDISYTTWLLIDNVVHEICCRTYRARVPHA